MTISKSFTSATQTTQEQKIGQEEAERVPLSSDYEDEDEGDHDHDHDHENQAIPSLALALNISLTKDDDSATLALKWFSWFTTLRLFFVRAWRERLVFEGIYSFTWHGYTTILQFSYVLEIIPCLIQLYNNPDLKYDKEWQNIFTNAFVWTIVNGVSLGTGLAGLNLVGFAFDIWHDYYYTDNEIKAQQEKLKTVQENSSDAKVIEAKIKELEYKKIRVTCVAVGLFIGMGLFYLNLIIPGLVPIIGASLVILFGGIIGNLGNRLFQWDKRLLIYFSEDNELKDIWRKELGVISSVGKLLKEFIKSLSPTLCNSLENCGKDPDNMLSSMISASLPTIALIYICYHFNIALFSIAPIPMLLIIAGILIATEVCVRLNNYRTYDTRVENITKKLEKISKVEQYNDNAHGFSCFSPLEIETLASLAEKSVEDLLIDIHLMHTESTKTNTEGSSAADAASNTAQSTGDNNSAYAASNNVLQVSTCKSSLFNSFKQAIGLRAQSLKPTENRQRFIIYAS